MAHNADEVKLTQTAINGTPLPQTPKAEVITESFNLFGGSNDNQFGRNEAYYKLQCYEDLEERFSSIFENLTLDDFINIFLKYIQEDNEEIRTGKILTNEDADKWNRWKSLEKSDRLVELKIACGQKVYTDDKTYNHGFEEYRVIDISLGGDMTYVAQSKSGFNLIFSDSDIGKTVFTTEEEAELALGGE